MNNWIGQCFSTTSPFTVRCKTESCCDFDRDYMNDIFIYSNAKHALVFIMTQDSVCRFFLHVISSSYFFLVVSINLIWFYFYLNLLQLRRKLFLSLLSHQLLECVTNYRVSEWNHIIDCNQFMEQVQKKITSSNDSN